MAKKSGGSVAGSPGNAHWEKKEGKLGHTSDMKYSGEMSAPEDYDRANKGLAEYVRKNKFKQ